MQDLKDILEDLEDLPKYQQLIQHREVQDLPKILSESEDVLYMATATMDYRRGLIIPTDENLFFLYSEEGHTRFFQMNYDDIKFIHSEKNSVENGSIEIFLPQSKVTFTNIACDDMPKLLEEIEDFSSYSFSTTTPSSNNGSCLGSIFKLVGFITCLLLAVGFSVGVYEDFTEDETKVEESESTYDYDDSLTKEEAKKEFKLKIKGTNIEKTGDTFTAKGKLVNESKNIYESVYIQIHFFDKDGNVVDSSRDIINNLKPGQTWSFKSDSYHDDTVSFDIIDISVF